jgi:hypothetical protein
MESSQRTYVVSVREEQGHATVEEVRTGRKARLGSLSEATAQIERWLDEAVVAPPLEPEEGR